MDNEETSKAACCEGSDDSLWGMVRTFWSRPMRSTVLFVWFWGLVVIAAAVYCGVRFFRTDNTQHQIAYAAGFLCLAHWIGLMKVFAWQMIHKRQLMQAIRRLEARIAECCPPRA